eukprot:3175510-Alexandrium_andersonii.AAC.1
MKSTAELRYLPEARSRARHLSGKGEGVHSTFPKLCGLVARQVDSRSIGPPTADPVSYTHLRAHETSAHL